MNYIKVLLCFFYLSVIIYTEALPQIKTILNEATKEPIENVPLFNALRNYSILTNADGKANITNFMENDSIFFQHPSCNKLVFTKLILFTDLFLK